MSQRSIILRKVGSFYQSYDEDAKIISYLFNYKIINNKCGFPLNTLDKIITKLEEKNINYIIKQEQELIKTYPNNQYDYYLEESKTKEQNKIIIDKIITNLNTLPLEQLQEILLLTEK